MSLFVYQFIYFVGQGRKGRLRHIGDGKENLIDERDKKRHKGEKIDTCLKQGKQAFVACIGNLLLGGVISSFVNMVC